MPTSGTTEAGLRLLGAFHDLSGGKLTEPVSVSEAAERAGVDTQSVESDLAVRYLLDNGYLKPTGTGDAYTLTVPGKDRVKEMRGMGAPAAPREGSGMSDKTQRRLLTVLGIVLSVVLTRPTTRYIGEMVPERRGMKDDALEAVLKGVVRVVSTFAASILVRRLARGR